MKLPEFDEEYLRAKGYQYEVQLDGGMLCVVIRNFKLPPGLNVSQSDLLLRLAAGYPDVTPDMWWFGTAVTYQNGQQIPQTQVNENYLGQQWQRWSRHFDQGRWKPGMDSIETFMAVVIGDLKKYAIQVA